ncbi:MAG: hypothetical protein SVT52_03690, partial [Planctomycetota bacterium]|nr:hypothetical protein [Planctomycetota bacterium]
GELFHFTIESPVDLPRRRSAMLPIINTNIQAEKLSIYNASVLAAHPLNGAWLKNDTGMKMLAGPVTVFDEGAYAGDAQVGNFVPNDKRLLSYAADLNVTVDSSVKSSEAITAVKIVRGVLTITRKRTYRQTYTIKNKANEPRTVIVEHPFNKRLKLLEPTKYEEKTAKLYRFRVPVDKQTTGKFDVVEEQPVSQTIAILTSPVKSFAWYSTSGKVSERVRAALGRAIELKNALSASQSKLKELEKQLARIKSGQDRLRRNISTAGRNSPLGQRYLKKLGREEDLIEQLDVKIESLRKQVAAQQKALADYLKDLNVS